MKDPVIMAREHGTELEQPFPSDRHNVRSILERFFGITSVGTLGLDRQIEAEDPRIR